MNIVVAVSAIVLLVLAAAFLRWIEVTFTRLSRARAAGLDEHAGNGDRLVLLVADRGRVIGPAALLRLLCQAGVVAIATSLAVDRVDSGGAVIAVVIAAPSLYVLTEAIPHRRAVEDNDRSARLLGGVARRLAGFPLLAWPLRPLLVIADALVPDVEPEHDPDVGEDELLALTEAAAASDVIDDDEAEIIESIIELGDTIAREVMVPRPDMITIDADGLVRDAVRLVLDHGYTRLPVSSGSIDDIVGVILAKDLMRVQLAGRIDATLTDVGVIRDIVFVPESKRASELMREMQSTRMHMVVVVDEYGGVAGLVTLEDVIEELVGEIVDEYDDEAPLIEDLGDQHVRVSGRLPIDELEPIVGEGLPLGDWDTVGGLVLELLGHIPAAGETVEAHGFEFMAERVDQRRVDSIIIRPLDAPVVDQPEPDEMTVTAETDESSPASSTPSGSGAAVPARATHEATP